jgi:hypothetical protein
VWTATGVGPGQPFDSSHTSIKSPLFAGLRISFLMAKWLF